MAESRNINIIILNFYCLHSYFPKSYYVLFVWCSRSLHLNTQRNHTGLILVMCIRVTYAKSMILWPDIPVMPVSSSTTCRTNQLKLSLFISLMMFQTCLLFLQPLSLMFKLLFYIQGQLIWGQVVSNSINHIKVIHYTTFYCKCNTFQAFKS